jgi:hypothetical protein
MKSNFNLKNEPKKRYSFTGAVFCVVVLAGLGWAILPGCKSQTPFDAVGYPGLTPTPSVTPVYPAPTFIPNRDIVCNFNGNSALINPNLMEMNNPSGGYVLKTGGSVTGVNNTPSAILLSVDQVEPGGPNGFAYAYNIKGTITDPGNASYPAMELEAQMEGGTNLYDGSFFTGVQFYLKIAADDNTTKRDFSIPVYQTQGSPQGGCVGAAAGGCYDNFTFNLSSGTSGQWEVFTIPFTSLAQAYAGVVTNPPTFSGANLQQMLWLQWEESRNNQIGTSTIDYWVGDIAFY